MNTHTLCLSGLILLMTLNPVSIAELVRMSLANKRIQLTKDFYLMLLATVYTFLVVAIYVVEQDVYYILFPKAYYWYVIAIIAAPLIIMLEAGMGYFLFMIQGMKLTKIKMISMGDSKFTTGISTFIVGIMEEVIYRQIWFLIGLQVLGMNVVVVLLLTSFFYGLNHITLGPYVFIQKLLSGVLYGLLFIFSGYTVVIPMIAHGIQNLIVVGRSE